MEITWSHWGLNFREEKLKKFFYLFLLFFLLFYCGDLDRDNPLDPKNPNSSVDRSILAEIFVNDSTGFEYCNYTLDAIEQLALREEYKDHLYILEYHLTNRTNDWNDLYAQDEFNQRYYSYIPTSNQRGIPDAMFNGLTKRVQGASLENINNNYVIAVDALLGQKGYFRIDAEKQIANNSIQLDVVVARHGSSGEEDIDLNVVLYEDLDTPRHRFVVRKIFQKQTIPSIKQGEIKSFRFVEQLPEVQNINRLFCLVFLQNQYDSNKEVYQVARF